MFKGETINTKGRIKCYSFLHSGGIRQKEEEKQEPKGKGKEYTKGKSYHKREITGKIYRGRGITEKNYRYRIIARSRNENEKNILN